MVQYLIQMNKLYSGSTRSGVRTMARGNNIPNSFLVLHEKAGKDWLKGFLKRHKNAVSVRKLIETSVAPANGFDEESVSAFMTFWNK